MKKYLFALLATVLGPGAILGQTLNTLVSTELSAPFGMAVDTNNDYYISDSGNNRILKFFSVSNISSNYAGVSGAVGFLDGSAFAARFSSPQGIVYARGGIVVADSGNHRIRFIQNGVVSTLAGSTPGAANGPGASAQFNSPAGLAADQAGNIYVADLLNNSIRKIALDNTVTTLAGGFLRPAGVAVTPDGSVIYVADTGDHSIKAFTNNVPNPLVGLVAGSNSRFVSGLADSVVGANALFNSPRGLLWVGGSTGLLVGDTGNHVLRQVLFNPDVNAYSVETFAASVGTGLIAPIGMATNITSDVLIVDAGANTLRGFVRAQIPIRDPVIGYFINLGTTNVAFVPFSNGSFNNDPVIGISGDGASATYFTLDGSTPTSTNRIAPAFSVTSSLSISSIIRSEDRQPNLVIKALSLAPGRSPSGLVSAQASFQVATPVINDTILGQVSIADDTANAELHYTLDGTVPTLSSPIYNAASKLDLSSITTSTLLSVVGFRPGYASSPATSQTVLPNSLRLTSSVTITRDYTGGIGSRVIIPVQLQLKPGDQVLTLQFRVELTPAVGNPPSVAISALNYATNQFIQATAGFLLGSPEQTNSYVGQGSAQGLIAAWFNPILSVASTVILTNSVNSSSAASFQVAVLSVPIPITAVAGQTYNISVLNPSATSDGQETPVSLAAGPNHTIFVQNIPYVVGDIARSFGYSSGEFGNGNLNNNDVLDIFKVSLGLLDVYANTDLFDAMDANQPDISGTAGGDGTIDIKDWNTVWLRSLRVDSTNYLRVRTASGGRTVVTTNLNSLPDSPADSLSSLNTSDAWVAHGNVSATTVENAVPGTEVKVPVYLKVVSGLSVSGAQFRADILSAADAPPVSGPVQFIPAAGIQSPLFNLGISGGVACGWSIGSFSPELRNNNLLGYVKFTIPTAAIKGQYYILRFAAVQASTVMPNGSFAKYHFESMPAAVWVQSAALKTLDIISDDWKLRFFGSVTNSLAQPGADPDGDGKSNLQEFLAGTNPAKLRFHLLDSDWRKNLTNGFKLRWFGGAGANFLIETSPDMSTWTAIGNITGTGAVQETQATNTQSATQYYRIRQAP